MGKESETFRDQRQIVARSCLSKNSFVADDARLTVWFEPNTDELLASLVVACVAMSLAEIGIKPERYGEKVSELIEAS